MLRRALPLLMLAAAWATPALAAPAFGISPFKVQVVPETPARKSQIFQLENGGTDPQAIQISIQDWMIDANGKETNAPNTASFSVYPEQFVLQPRSSQSVRVTWREGMPESERAFRLIAEQLPVDFDGQTGSSGIRFLLAYRAALYITPPQATSQVEVEHFQTMTEGDKHIVALKLVNKGKAHTLLSAPVLLITQSDGTTVRLQGDALKDVLADRNIHAGGTLNTRVPLPATMTPDIKTLTLEFTPAI